MKVFFFKGIDGSGKMVEGSIEAFNRQAASKMLIARRVKVTQLKVLQGSNASRDSSLLSFFRLNRAGHRRRDLGTYKDKKVTQDFLAKVLQLHKSGMPIGDAIKSLKERLSDPAMKQLAANIWSALSEGQTLAVALGRYPQIFDNTIIYAIQAGEASGNLKPILENIVEHLREQAELKKKIFAGLAYPVFLSFVAIGVVALFLFYLLPRIEGMMKSLGGEMTWSAKLLIGSADFLVFYGPFIAIAMGIFALFISQWRKKEKGRCVTDEWFLKIPFLGNLIHCSSICQASNLLATLIESGVNTTEAMRLTEKLIQNRTLNERFQMSQKMINDGLAISTAFKQSKFFPRLATDVLSVGENTGKMAPSFKEIYSIYNEDLSSKLKKMTTMLSSGALLVAFILVSVLALSIVTSVLQFSNSLL